MKENNSKILRKNGYMFSVKVELDSNIFCNIGKNEIKEEKYSDEIDIIEELKREIKILHIL